MNDDAVGDALEDDDGLYVQALLSTSFVKVI